MQQPPDRAIDIAKAMLKRRWIKPRPPAKNGDVVRALALTIAATPAHSSPGQELVRLFSGHHPHEGNERHILHALRNGQPAYERVIVEEARRSRIREERQAAFVRTLDGALAAEHVAETVAATDDGPTWVELGKVMGWHRGENVHVIRLLARGGWLRYRDGVYRSLRPGPRHHATA